jgi:hypothetical protein
MKLQDVILKAIAKKYLQTPTRPGWGTLGSTGKLGSMRPVIPQRKPSALPNATRGVMWVIWTWRLRSMMSKLALDGYTSSAPASGYRTVDRSQS